MTRGVSHPPELIDRLLAHIADGKPAAQFYRANGLSKETVTYWTHTDPLFKRRYQEARDIGFDAIAERLRGTARGKSDGDEGESTGDWARDRLIVETDMKLLAKWAPKKYGERVEIEHSIGTEDIASIGDRLEGLLTKAFTALALAPPEAEDRW